MTCYEILEIDMSATQDEIKRKYRLLVRVYHADKRNSENPDVLKFLDEKLKDINHAYEILGDPTKRAQYDQTLKKGTTGGSKTYSSSQEKQKESNDVKTPEPNPEDLKFTKEQMAVFEFIKSGTGNGIIDAVAGSGKTTTIMECAKYVDNKSDILFCAFNNSIQREIAKKFHKRGFNDVVVKTIHSLGYQILKDNDRQKWTLDDKKYNKLLKTNEMRERTKGIYEHIVKLMGFDPKDESKRNVSAKKSIVSDIDSKILDINEKFRSTLASENLKAFEHMINHFTIFNDIVKANKNYKKILEDYYELEMMLLKQGNEIAESSQKIDFTDMLYLPHKWKQYPSQKFSFIFIDEAQDLSKSQVAVVAKCGKPTARVMAVGDPYQSIYGFTGADVNSFVFVKTVFNAAKFPLSHCFRCPQDVISIAAQIRPGIVGVKKTPGVVRNIPSDRVISMARTGDLVISRFRAPLLSLVFEYIDRMKKVNVHEDEVEAIINDIRSIFKKEDLVLKISTLAHGFDTLRVQTISFREWVIRKEAEQIENPAERDLHIKSEIALLLKKLDFLQKKFAMWSPLGIDTVEDLLKKIHEYLTSSEDSIILSTIHRAKGLENQRVFILAYDKLPLKKHDMQPWEEEQELNLKYVAVTRSLNELYLVDSEPIQKLDQKGSLFDNITSSGLFDMYE
jgi:superfamily I DNA/RNA helicase